MKTRSFSEADSNKHKLVGNIIKEGSLKEKGNKESWEFLKEATLRDPLLTSISLQNIERQGKKEAGTQSDQIRHFVELRHQKR